MGARKTPSRFHEREPWNRALGASLPKFKNVQGDQWGEKTIFWSLEHWNGSGVLWRSRRGFLGLGLRDRGIRLRCECLGSEWQRKQQEVRDWWSWRGSSLNNKTKQKDLILAFIVPINFIWVKNVKKTGFSAIFKLYLQSPAFQRNKTIWVPSPFEKRTLFQNWFQYEPLCWITAHLRTQKQKRNGFPL